MAAVVLAGLGLGLWQLALPGHLLGITEYDDGVYLGAAVRLVSGALPYRSFVLVQPPGIVVLMVPVALLAHLTGTAVALGVARVVTAVVAAADAGLLAWLLRGRGVAAMAVAGGGLALFPLAVAADHTLLLEPYVVLFVLLGSVVALGRDEPSPLRLAVAGACFGVGGAVKLWAVFPFLALAACVAARQHRRVAWLVLGAAAGLGAICLPFLALAPSAFVHEVLLDQLARGAAGANGVGLATRLTELTGLAGVPALPGALAFTLAGLGALAVLTSVAAVAGRPGWRWGDTYLVAAAATSVAGLLAASEWYPHYALFTAPFLAAVLAIAVSGTARALGARRRRVRGAPRRLRPTALVAAALGIALAGLLAASDVHEDSTFLPASLHTPSGAIVDPGPAIARVVAAGACVVFDDPVLALEADRFTSSRPGCPAQVDPYGMWLADGHGGGPPAAAPYPVALVAAWRAELSRADDVVLTSASSGYVPWTPALRSLLARRFVPVLSVQDAVVYARRGR